MPAVYIRNLAKNYGAQQVLKKLDLTIEEGQFYALMGPNGSGKSTLAAILASVVTRDDGVVEIYGRRPEQARRWTGYIPQENFSIPQLTGRENLAYFSGLCGYSGRRASRMVDDLLQKIGLAAEADKKAAQYSGGMRKRLELATALLPDIRLLILDEPTSGLDPAARRDFFKLIQEVKKQSTAILLITHTGTDAELADRVGLIDRGRIIAEDTPMGLRSTCGRGDVITIETAAHSAMAAGLLRGYSLRQPISESAGGYRLYAENGEKIVPELIQVLARSGIRVIRSEVSQATLEDVFFKLTEKVRQEVM
jgi:ABC-2 type transport system ATP-binding protein